MSCWVVRHQSPILSLITVLSFVSSDACQCPLMVSPSSGHSSKAQKTARLTASGMLSISLYVKHLRAFLML